MLHSFGLRFKPWTEYAQFIRSGITRRSQTPVDFHDHSLLNARLADDKADGPFVDYFQLSMRTNLPTSSLLSGPRLRTSSSATAKAFSLASRCFYPSWRLAEMALANALRCPPQLIMTAVDAGESATGDRHQLQNVLTAKLQPGRFACPVKRAICRPRTLRTSRRCRATLKTSRSRPEQSIQEALGPLL